jgi:hypothetical protein
MTADDQIRPAAARFDGLPGVRRRMRALARRVLWSVARPYARRRARQAEVAAGLVLLEKDFQHVSERHTEQIERLEELVRELVLTAESLRRASADRETGGER